MNRSALLIALLAALAVAQAPYRLTEWVMAGGGRRMADPAGAYVVNGSTHQTTIGRAAPDDGADLAAWIGYWHPWPFVARHDVGVVAIESPIGTVDTLLGFTPSATVGNFGSFTETFDVIFTITRTNGSPLYSNRITVTLAPQDRQLRTFASLRITAVGPYVARCSTALATDENRGNDVVAHVFKVLTRPPWPRGWYEVTPMPAGPSGRPVRRGGWVSYMPARQMFHAAKGNKTGDFYAFNPATNRWHELRSVPFAPDGKFPSGGAAGASDGERFVYATKGNNTNSFWRYDAAADTWQRLADVPLGWSNKRLKGGGDLAYTTEHGVGYVYLLKGGKSEFWRYNTLTGAWDSMPDAPRGNAPKWNKGSWLCSDGLSVYALKAKYNEFWKFDAEGDTWFRRPLSPLPIYNPRTGRNKRAKEGSSGAWYDNGVYALKGGNTQEFWRYYADGDSWAELETLPVLGTGRRNIRVKDGGDIAGFGEGVFLALKGNKSTEVWRYVLSSEMISPAPQRSGVMAGPQSVPDRPSLDAGPNPAADRVLVSYNLPTTLAPSAPRLLVHDACGRMVLERRLAGRTGTVEFDLGSFSPGVYFLKLPTAGGALTRKLVVER